MITKLPPPYTIDTTTYNKVARGIGIGNGWDYRPKGMLPSSIIIHSTNGKRGSSFAGEAKFLRDSTAVGCAYLVGKRGQIAMIVDPLLRAHQAGAALLDFINSKSIGIECHHAVGEVWTLDQEQALTWLVRSLMERFTIDASKIETHRAVALPEGRKVDPSDWSDYDFYCWRAELSHRRYVITTVGSNVRMLPSTQHRVVRMLFPTYGQIAGIPVQGEVVGGSDVWVSTPLGYVHSSLVQEVTG